VPGEGGGTKGGRHNEGGARRGRYQVTVGGRGEAPDRGGEVAGGSGEVRK
jgi:hypothetical protein